METLPILDTRRSTSALKSVLVLGVGVMMTLCAFFLSPRPDSVSAGGISYAGSER